MADLLQEADEIRADAERTKRKAEDSLDYLKKKTNDAWNDTMELVKRHPSKAIGIAVGTGLVVGTALAALSRRRDESAGNRLKGLAGSGVAAWDRVKSGFDEAMGALKDAVEEAAEQFK